MIDIERNKFYLETCFIDSFEEIVESTAKNGDISQLSEEDYQLIVEDFFEDLKAKLKKII